MRSDSWENRIGKSSALDDLVAARPLSILIVPFVTGLIATLIFPLGILNFPRAQVVGVALITLGYLLGHWALRAMAAGGASPDAFRAPQALITDGPFRFTRNPIYLGFVLIYLGMGMILNSAWVVLLTPVVVIALTLAIIVRDERLLENHFGDQYADYRARTRRWL